MKFTKNVILFSLAISILTLSFSIIDTQALEQKVFTKTDAEIKIETEQKVEELKNQITSPRMDEIIYEWRNQGTKKTGWSSFLVCLGQYDDGVVFPSSGSGFYWQDSTESVGTATLSIGFSVGPASASVSLQPGRKATESTSYFIKCTTPGVHVKLYAARTYAVTRYAVNRYNKYDSSKKVFDHYEDISVTASVNWQIRKV